MLENIPWVPWPPAILIKPVAGSRAVPTVALPLDWIRSPIALPALPRLVMVASFGNMVSETAPRVVGLVMLARFTALPEPLTLVTPD
jgi:hypothetical protein